VGIERLFRLVDWLLPPRCGSCHAVGAWLCPACLAGIRPLREPLCRRCGRELSFAGDSCGCRHRLRALARARAAADYRGPLERAVHRFKYEGWRALAPALAALAADRLAGEVPAGALLVAVPLHRRRQRRRGYNQSELLAVELRRRLRLAGPGSAGTPAGCLLRLRDTPPQVGLDRVRRQANVDAAFGWRGTPLGGRPVVVVDDVTTTGATLEACATALRAAGSGPVVGLTIARVTI
jgi:ComF family protein